MTELGKAYVQIVPSAQGISGSIQKLLGGEADSAGEAVGGSLGSKLVGTAMKVIAAAGIGKMLKDSIMEGGALEQSIGGIETLFKGSADTVKNYAKEAYQTAGISANQYMEQVTSFSALGSLPIDTGLQGKTFQVTWLSSDQKVELALLKDDGTQGQFHYVAYDWNLIKI
nr:MAG TPA: tail tape measure protein [Caudoviricetes sp.]